MELMWTEEEIKKVFWDVFHGSGEKWFGNETDLRDPENDNSETKFYWEDFLDALKKEKNGTETG